MVTGNDGLNALILSIMQQTKITLMMEKAAALTSIDIQQSFSSHSLITDGDGGDDATILLSNVTAERRLEVKAKVC